MKKLINKIKNKTGYLIKTSKVFNKEGYLEAKHEKEGKYPIRDNIYHVREAVGWLKQAQDSASDGGVARGYSLTWDPFFGSKGWQPPYPETTGYIIPTFYECAKHLNDEDLSRRAESMADWEIAIQMGNGAVRGGVLDSSKPVPSVFCTGQVVFGLLRTYKETRKDKYLKAALSAGDFLVSTQDNSGELVEDKEYNFVANRKSTVYHTRVAWSLVLLGKVAGNEKYISAGINNVEYNLGFQEKNGWFQNNCIGNPEKPLLHTICYAMRGLLETGLLLRNEKYISAARIAADSLLSILDKGGYIPGRLDKYWESDFNWRCITGDAQLAIIFLKLYQNGGEERYLAGADKLIELVKITQNCLTPNSGFRGGIKGSYPVSGEYGRFQILNWATKFFTDALLLRIIISDHKK